jgi:hypothetical protein
VSTARTLAAEVAEAIAATLATLHPAGNAIWEIRAPKMARRGTVSGYYDSAEQCARDVAMQLDVAALARRTDRAQHAEAACYLLDAVRAAWLAGEALAEGEEASA